MANATVVDAESTGCDSGVDAVALRARWLEQLPDGETRREATLRLLRSGQPVRAETADLRGISLIGEDLRGLDVSGCDLSDADLSEADLSEGKFVRADLRGASLYKAKLDGAELLGVQAAGANMSECSAVRAGFGHADLRGAVLFQADLTGATLSHAILTGADLRTARLEGARLRAVELGEANLARASLVSAELCGSGVDGAEFENSDLRGAHLRGMQHFETATWIGVDIRDVNFSGAYLLRRWIMDENYLFEFRTRSRYCALVYRLWWLTSDCGRSLGRWFAWNLVVALLFGCAYTLVAVDFGAHRTALSPFYFSFVTLTTLGYGDVLPASSTAQVVAVVEVLIGYLGLGGLLSIFAAKMGRRAD